MIVETIEKENYPRILVMGSDAVSFVKSIYEKKLNELEAWEKISVQSDFE